MNYNAACNLIELLKKCTCKLCNDEIARLKNKYAFDSQKDNKGEPERDAERLSEKTPKGEAIV